MIDTISKILGFLTTVLFLSVFVFGAIGLYIWLNPQTFLEKVGFMIIEICYLWWFSDKIFKQKGVKNA